MEESKGITKITIQEKIKCAEEIRKVLRKHTDEYSAACKLMAFAHDVIRDDY